MTNRGPRISPSERPSGRVSLDLAKFAGVGIIATLVSATLFNVLVHQSPDGDATLNDQPITGYLIANLVGMTVSYAGTRLWAFRNRVATGSAGGLVGFVAVNVASWTVPLTCLTLSRYVLGLDSPWADNIAANVIGLSLGTLLRFWLLRRLVFVATTTSPHITRQSEGQP